MKVICVSGCVGTGKSTLARKLSKALKFQYLDVTKLIKENNLIDSYDKKNKCNVVDVKKLNKFLIEIIKNSKNSLIIDSHLSHYLDRKYVDLCIVTTCDISVLKTRLKKRGYSAKKIKDNLEAEIFDTIVLEAKQRKHKLMVVDTTKGYTVKEIIKEIKKK